MAKSKPFTEQDLFSKGFEKDESGAFIKPIHKNLDVFPKSFTEPNNDIVGEIPEVKLDIKTEWFIKGEVISKKNTRNIFLNKGRLMNLPSKAYQEYVTATKMQYTVFGIEFRRAVKFYALEYPLYIEFTFIRKSKRAFDICNVCQSVEDLMKDEYKKNKDKKMVLISRNWIDDDSADHLIPVFKPYSIDKENPGVLIRLITNK